MPKRNHAGKFLHFRPEDTDKTTSCGGMTISYLYDEVEGKGRIRAGYAFCNPTDNFSYAYGREKADGRLKQLIASGVISAASQVTTLQTTLSEEQVVNFLVRYADQELGYIGRRA